ncbi:MAG: bifunctional YncE family protein/alkaline phosphatase family protein [Acidiphilium sp.]|nr:bifunctional YncE family protein/alkaline phosphatase family protein [Acidiphilium sp.]
MPASRPSTGIVIIALTLTALACGAWSGPPDAPVTITSANQTAYTHTLPAGRLAAPVGTIVATPNFPTGVAILGHRIAVLANGASRAQSIAFYDRTTLTAETSLIGLAKPLKAPLPSGAQVLKHQDFFQGLATGPTGTLYAAGGASNNILAIDAAGPTPRVIHTYRLTWQPFPHNQYPYVYQGAHHADVHKPAGLEADKQSHPRYFFPDAVAATAHHVFTTGLLANSLARIDLATGATTYLNVGAYPNAIAFADHGKILAVSLWGDNAVALVDPTTMKLLAKIAVGPHLTATSIEAGLHPIALAGRRSTPHLYVALANGDQIVEIDTTTGKILRRISVLPYRNAASGSYPDALALDGTRLYVANAGNDDIMTIDTRTGAERGLTPTGWYPTALAVTAHHLYAVAAKGLGSGPNLHHQWVGDMMHGLLQQIPRHTAPSAQTAFTRAALADNHFLPEQRAALAARNARATRRLDRRIHTVVLILRENKTFDEEFGRYPGLGHWADPQLDLYDRKELPNLYHMAATGALFVDFDADGEVTAQGHQWTTAASDSDFVQRTWGQYYSNRGLQGNPGWTQPLSTPGKNTDPDDPFADDIDLAKLRRPATNPWISYPNGRFLFDDLSRHHVGFENFGEFIARDRAGTVRPAILASTDAGCPGWDRMLLDTVRARVVDRWIAAHRTAMPRFIYIWLPDDHTAGRNPCYYTPDYYVANNDEATAQIVSALSHTTAWAHMAVFVTEDDAQSGADHINAHRTFLVAYGPWVKPATIMTKPYSQVDLIRTIEAVTHIPPLSQWDQNARVISGIWAHHPDDAPFTPLPMQTARAVNPGTCTLATRLRFDAGTSGKLLTPAFAAAHGKAADLTPGDRYTPTSLLKVAGGEQMRQEWIASKGKASYQHVMNALTRYAAAKGAPLTAFRAND